MISKLLPVFRLLIYGCWRSINIHKIKGLKILEQIILLLLQPFSDELFVLPSKMIHKFCLLVYSIFFQVPRVVSIKKLQHKPCIPNMGNSYYVAPLFCILQLFLLKRLLLCKLFSLIKW